MTNEGCCALSCSSVNNRGLSLHVTPPPSISHSFVLRRWPKPIKSVLNVVSVSNLNIEIVSPECTISFAYHEKWLAIQCTPFILILSGVLFHYIVLARKQLCGCLSKFKKRKHGDMYRHLNAIVGSIILLFYFCYIYCTWREERERRQRGNRRGEREERRAARWRPCNVDRLLVRTRS